MRKSNEVEEDSNRRERENKKKTRKTGIQLNGVTETVMKW